jgi:hypothetical protein
MRWVFLIAAALPVAATLGEATLSIAGMESNAVVIAAHPEPGMAGVVERSADLANWHEAALAEDGRSIALPLADSMQFFRLRTVEILLEHKAGSAREISLLGSAVPAEWLIEGALPEGLGFSGGAFSGAPTASAAEASATGLYTNLVAMVARMTNSATGQVITNRSTATMVHRVRLSFSRNIYAERPGGPSLGTICIKCHGSGFPPDFTPSAGTLIDVRSGGVEEQECGTEERYIVPGSLSESLIFQKVLGQACGARMPQGGPYFDETQIQRLARWISELRPGETD